MMEARKVVCGAAALLLVLTLASAPAKAQLAGFGGGGGDGDMMTQMAPMLEMMKAKMGKKRFATMMQTMGPMMGRMMEGGGGLGGGGAFAPEGYGMGMGGGDVMGILGGGGGEMMSMIPQLMQMANFGGGHGRRHHRRRDAGAIRFASVYLCGIGASRPRRTELGGQARFSRPSVPIASK